MGLELTVLGCCGTYAKPGGACSGYLVRDDSTRVWVDAGPGTLANVQRHVSFDDIDALVLSHDHPDHWTDLEGFYNVCRFITERRGFPVYAPPGLRDKTYEDTSEYLDWHDVGDGDSLGIGSLSFTFSRTDHGPPTVAMRIEGAGRALGYSADTGPGWSPVALGDRLDALLCEATFQAEQEGVAQHLSARQAAAKAREAGVDRLLLTHIWPTLDPARSLDEGSEAFGSEVTLAATGEAYEI